MRRVCLRCVAPFHLAVVGLALLAARPARADVRFDNAASAVGTNGSASFDLTIGTGPDRIVLVVTATSGAGPSFVSVGGLQLVPFAAGVGPTCRVDVYGRTGPASGKQTVSITVGARTAFAAAAISYDGVAQSSPTEDSSGQNSGSGGAASVGAIRDPGPASTFAALCAQGTMVTATSSVTGEFVRAGQAAGGIFGSAADGANVQLGWSLRASGGLTWAATACPLKASANGLPATPVDAGLAARDAAVKPDAASPPDASPPDAAAAVDAAPSPPEPPPPPRDAATTDVSAGVPRDAGGRAPAEDAATIARPAPRDQPDAASDGVRIRVVDLAVQTGCAIGGGGSPAALALAGLALAILGARRRRT